MSNEPTAGSPHRHPALFSWFPAHSVHRSEHDLRAESLLSNIPLFDAVPAYRLRAITQMARTNRFSAGETVFREGDRGSTLHVIRSGHMNVVRESEKGEIVILASLGPGEFFGELSLFDNQPRSATVVSAENGETLSLDRADILEIVTRYPEVALAFLCSMSGRLRGADNLLENLHSHEPVGDGRD